MILRARPSALQRWRPFLFQPCGLGLPAPCPSCSAPPCWPVSKSVRASGHLAAALPGLLADRWGYRLERFASGVYVQQYTTKPNRCIGFYRSVPASHQSLINGQGLAGGAWNDKGPAPLPRAGPLIVLVSVRHLFGQAAAPSLASLPCQRPGWRGALSGPRLPSPHRPAAFLAST